MNYKFYDFKRLKLRFTLSRHDQRLTLGEKVSQNEKLTASLQRQVDELVDQLDDAENALISFRDLARSKFKP